MGRVYTKKGRELQRRLKALNEAKAQLRIALSEGASVSSIHTIVALAFDAEGYHIAAQSCKLAAEASGE